MKRSWFLYVLPVTHLSACLISWIGLIVPKLQFLGIVWTFVMVFDLPVSVPAYVLGWKHSALAVVWVFLGGTVWWYFLSCGAERVINKLTTGRRAETL